MAGESATISTFLCLWLMWEFSLLPRHEHSMIITCQSCAFKWKLCIICSIMLVHFLGTTSTFNYEIPLFTHFQIYTTFLPEGPLPPALEKSLSMLPGLQCFLTNGCPSFCSGPTTTWSLYTMRGNHFRMQIRSNPSLVYKAFTGSALYVE